MLALRREQQESMRIYKYPVPPPHSSTTSPPEINNSTSNVHATYFMGPAKGQPMSVASATCMFVVGDRLWQTGGCF